MVAASETKTSPGHDVFISYSRKDKEFVRRLDAALQIRGREAWVDWEAIRPSEEFMQAIYAAIEGADTFVFVLSPDSLVSEVCGRELAHAAAHNKRMVPIVVREVDAKAVPEPLAKLNWIFFREGDDIETAAAALIKALETDLGWVHSHTRLLTRALEWEAKGKSKSFALRGEDLGSAEQWLAQAGAEKERQPTALQTEYIIGSRKAAARRQRIMLGAVSFGAVVAVALAFVALVARSRAEIERTKAEAATKRATLARDEAGKLIEFMSFDLRDKLLPIGRLDLLDDVNQRVSAFYDSFRGEDESPELLRQRAALLQNQGDVAREQGNLASALPNYRDSLSILERLFKRDAQDAVGAHNLSIVYSRYGDAQREQGDLNGALKSYRESLQIGLKMMLQEMFNLVWQRDVSSAYEKIGDIQRDQGDLAGALKSYRDSLATTEKLAQQDPADAVSQHNLSVSHSRVGDVLSDQGDLAGALESYRSSRTIRETVVKQDPGNALWQRALSAIDYKIGGLLLDQGDLTGALQSYRDSLTISEKLAKQDPSNARWQSDLSTLYVNLGEVQRQQGQLTEALASYRDSLVIREKLAKQDPANAARQSDLAFAYMKIGDLQGLEGKQAEALKSHRASLVIRERLAEQDVTNTEWQSELAASYCKVGAWLSKVERGSKKEAREMVEKGQAILQRLKERTGLTADQENSLQLVSTVLRMMDEQE